jgi:4-hydroxy-3-methylbut-2-en-1-yl diphosphate reductase
LCEQKLGAKAFFIKSEANILSRDHVDHYVYGHGTGHTESRPLWPTCGQPKRILITGGASCPDGIIQQVITRINSFFPADQLRSIETVLATLR